MKKINDYVVYRHDVSKIVDIKVNTVNNQNYYVLIPVNDESLKIDVPVDSDKIRELITRRELDNLIDQIPSIPIIDSSNKLIENDYKKLLKEGNYASLIKIIKTTYLRNQERINNKKKKGDRDNYYFNLAENYLYTEFMIVLGKSFEETKEYLLSKVHDVITKNKTIK